MKNPLPIAAALVALTSAGQAQTIDFEAPLYPTGLLTTTTVGSSTPAEFNGVNGWAQSSSGGKGAIVTTTTSGLYEGGQALGSGDPSNAYIGANNGFVLGAKFSFDILAPTANKAGVSGFADINNDGLVTYTTENGIFAGVLDSGGVSRFAFRDKAITGSSYLSPVSASTTDWYRITVTLDDPSYTATMDVINLTQGGTVVDLNPTGDGTSFSHTWTGGTGWIPASSFDGVGARASAGILIDNITNIPEPGSVSLALLGGLALLGNRLRRRQ